MLAVVVSSLDQNIVLVSLPRIAIDLGSFANISWAVTAFLLTSTISAPVYGRLSDMYGRRRLFAVSMAVFLATSILCSFARSMPELIAARAVQGLGGGGLMTLSQSAIGDLVGPRARGRYQGYFSAAMGTSTVLGPLLGGMLIAKFSWRWIFLVTLPIGVTSIALINVGLRSVHTAKPHRIDVLGVLLLAAGTCAVFLCIHVLESGLPATGIVAMGAVTVAAACGYLFVRQERRSTEPLLDLRLFSNRHFTVGTIAAGMMTFAMQGALVFLPLYLQVVQGQTPTQSGLILIAHIVGMLVSSIVGGRQSARSGQFKKFFVAGVALEMLALTALAVSAVLDAGRGAFIAALMLLGLGAGIGMPNAIVVVQNAVPARMMGVATAAMSFGRSLGASVGVVLSGCLMQYTFTTILKSRGIRDVSMSSLDRGIDLVHGVAVGNEAAVSALRLAIASSFALAASMMLAAVATAATLPRKTPRES